MSARRPVLSARPALPDPPTETARPRTKRLNVDLLEGDHQAVKAWALEARVDASSLIRAMCYLANESPRWRIEVEGRARQLADERREARR